MPMAYANPPCLVCTGLKSSRPLRPQTGYAARRGSMSARPPTTTTGGTSSSRSSDRPLLRHPLWPLHGPRSATPMASAPPPHWTSLSWRRSHREATASAAALPRRPPQASGLAPAGPHCCSAQGGSSAGAQAAAYGAPGLQPGGPGRSNPAEQQDIARTQRVVKIARQVRAGMQDTDANAAWALKQFLEWK
jgi:hypothetical protein